VAGSVKNRSTGIIMLDLFSIRNEQEFYQALATEAIKATAGKIIGWIELRKTVFKTYYAKDFRGRSGTGLRHQL
jgi:hypothetical protein